MSVRNGIFTGIACAMLATFSSAAMGHKVETNTTTVMKFTPNSEAAYSVASWLDDRAQQGQYSRSSKLSPVADANITVEISTVATPGETTPSGLCSDPTSCTPGGTVLPLTGTSGEKIAITDCISASYTETVTYVYQCDSSGGCHWVQISYTLKMNKSIECGA